MGVLALTAYMCNCAPSRRVSAFPFSRATRRGGVLEHAANVNLWIEERASRTHALCTTACLMLAMDAEVVMARYCSS